MANTRRPSDSTARRMGVEVFHCTRLRGGALRTGSKWVMIHRALHRLPVLVSCRRHPSCVDRPAGLARAGDDEGRSLPPDYHRIQARPCWQMATPPPPPSLLARPHQTSPAPGASIIVPEFPPRSFAAVCCYYSPASVAPSRPAA